MISAEQLGERYLQTHHRLRRTVDGGMSECGLTLAGTWVLAQLQLSGPVRPGALADEFGVAPRTITDVVDTLERDGLAARRPDPTDRRALLVALTSEGETAVAVAGATTARLLRQVFGALDAADRQTMARLLDALDVAAAAVSTDVPVPGPAPVA
jgi:DNA-binding MarR family transcriptional regulator